MDSKRPRHVVGSLVLGLILGAGTIMGVNTVRASGQDVRTSLVRSDLELVEIAGKPIVDGRVQIVTEEWNVRSGARVAGDVLAWIDRHMGPDDTAETFGYDPSRAPWKEEVHRGSLWRSVLPAGLELYVFERYRLVGMDPEFWLFLRDAADVRISPEPYRVTARWIGRKNSTTPPRIERVELDGQGAAEFVFHGVGHNGTLYNAKQEFYLEQMADLGLKPALVLDALLYWPFEGNAGDVHRSLEREVPNRLTMHVHQFNHETGARQAIGRATLTRDAVGETFVVASRQALAAKAERFLVPSDEH